MVILLFGPMGCGKTTIGRRLAELLAWRFEDADDFHPPANVAKMKAGVPLDDEDRLPWLSILHTLISEHVQRGDNLILACSALKQRYRDLLGVDQRLVCSVYLQASREVLERRIAKRTHQYMAPDLLASQLSALEEPVDGFIVSVEGTPEEAVRRIVADICELGQKEVDKTV